VSETAVSEAGANPALSRNCDPLLPRGPPPAGSGASQVASPRSAK